MFSFKTALPQRIVMYKNIIHHVGFDPKLTGKIRVLGASKATRMHKDQVGSNVNESPLEAEPVKIQYILYYFS